MDKPQTTCKHGKPEMIVCQECDAENSKKTFTMPQPQTTFPCKCCGKQTNSELGGWHDTPFTGPFWYCVKCKPLLINESFGPMEREP